MKLIENWKMIAKRSHSMWAFYLSALALVVPDGLWLAFEVDTSPRLWWLIAFGLLVYGIAGRLKDQGIDRTKIRSPAWMAALVIAVAALGGAWTARTPAPQGEIAKVSDISPVPAQRAESAFLEIALPLVSKWEGLRTTAYRDPVGILTVCYGETEGVRPGDVYTAEECAAMLGRRILEYRAGLRLYFTEETQARRLPPARDAAYSSLAYNVGIAGAGKSTAVRRLNDGNIRGGCEAIGWWNKAGGRVLRGLVNRRAEEVALCLRGLAA